MEKNRLEAFSDGVMAIIITIMVLELKVPHGNDLAALSSRLPVFLSCVLAFVNSWIATGLYAFVALLWLIPDRRIERALAPAHSLIMTQHLPELRTALLNLHKALVDSERVSYEQTIGSIPSPNYFLQLLTSDPWFAWLHPLSQLIVAMDEALDAKEPLTPAVAKAFVQQTRRLLVASENGEGFSRHYYDALQRDPDVVLAHGEVAARLGRRKE